MNNFNKIICTLLTFSLVIYPFPHGTAYAGLKENKLAAKSRINKYVEANELAIDTVKFTMAVSDLRQTIIEENGDKKQIQTAIRRIQDELLKDTGIKIEEKIYRVKLQKSGSNAICLKVIFPGDEIRWIYFVKEPAALTKKALEKLRIIKGNKNYDEDINYLLKGPLTGVWLSRNGPESRYGKGTKIASMAILIPFIAILLQGCLKPPSLKDYEGFCFLGQDCVPTDSQSQADIPQGETPFEIVQGDAVINPPEGVEESSPDAIEPSPDVAESSPETVPPSDVAEPSPEITPPLDSEGDEVGIVEEVEVVEVVDTFPSDEIPDKEMGPELQQDVGDDKETVQPDTGEPDYIEKSILAILDITQNPVTLLPVDAKFTTDGSYSIYPDGIFLKNNNAAFKHKANTLSWELTPQISLTIATDGIDYIYNGVSHKLTIEGIDASGKTKSIIITPQIFDMVDTKLPYRVSIPSSVIKDLLLQMEISPNKITKISFLIEQPGVDFILNGLIGQFAVLSTSEEVTPDIISPKWEVFSTGGADISATPAPEGIDLNFAMTAGDNGQSVGLIIHTKSGGIPSSDPDLKAAWEMNGVELGTDSGPNGNTLTNVNGVESVSGKHGSAAQFTAANQSYLVIPPEEQIGLNITGDMTISAWINVTDYPKQGFTIAAKQSGPGAENVDYSFYLSNGYMSSWNGSTNVYVDFQIPNGEWHHVAMVRQGNNITFYLDGIPHGPFGQIFTQPAEDAPLYIGYNGLSAYANGLIDELAVFGRALTPEEIQTIYKQIDSSNFLTPFLSTIELMVKNKAPFMFSLIDDFDQVLDVFVLELDPDNWKSGIIELIKAQAVMNPLFNLGKVKHVQFSIEDTFLPVPDGEIFESVMKIKGGVGIPPTTRHRYATDYHDQDLTMDDYEKLVRNIEKADSVLIDTGAGIPVIGIRNWQDENGENLLLENGLGFTVNNRIYSAFTVRDGASNIIYIPHPNLIISRLDIGDGHIKDRILDSVKKRNKIILGHEIDEINGLDHKEAVFNEFSNNSINGLNYADVVTVLLETLTIENIGVIDEAFHRQFIANLLVQGMFLDKEGNTYIRIIEETIDDRVDEDSLRQLYSRILTEITDLVSSHRFTHRRLHKEETSYILDTELVKEPGFNELFTAIGESKRTGTIYIDLARFFVRNNSLTTEDEVVTINTEYLRRFASFIHKIKGSNVRVAGIYDKRYNGKPVIEELISFIRRDFDLSETQFAISSEGIDFSQYLGYLGGSEKAKSIVSILTEDSWRRISDRSALKIVDSFMDRYNRVNSCGWEFYAALKGLDYDTTGDFLQFIIDEVLKQLVSQNVITKDEADSLRQEILEKGIAFIPAYFDPILYYRSIEHMKQLLIAA